MIARALSAILPERRAATDFGPLSDFWYNPVGSTSSAGIVVKPDSAMGTAAVFSCIRFLAEMIGCLDFEVYGRTGGSEVADDSHYLWNTIRNRPNGWQTPMEWGEMGMAHLCLRGNFYCQIVDGPMGMELWPLVPDRMKPQQNDRMQVSYVYHPKVGETRTFRAREILHIRGMTMDGVTGISVLEYAKNAVGSALAQETHGAALFKNGGLPAFWIGRPQGLKFTQDARKNFRAGWRKLHGGAENAGNPPILEDGMELHELGLTNRDSQWIESREFQALDICRFFRVNPHIIYASKESRPDLEQLSNETKRYTLYPWVRRWCQAMDRDLIETGDKNHFVHMDMDDLDLVAMLARYQANNVAIQGGWKLPNEARSDEGWDPIDGGDMARFPLNMQPAGGGPDEQQQGGQPGKGTPKPPQQKQPDSEPADDDTAYQKRKKKVAQAAFVVLLDEAAARIAWGEIQGLSLRADKVEQNRGKWVKWALNFYAKHLLYVARTLDPICAAWLVATGEKHEPGELAATYCGLSPSLDYGADIPAVLEDWKTTRGPWLAEQLKKELFDETL